MTSKIRIHTSMAIAVVLLALVAVLLPGATSADAASRWASVGSATIRPGVLLTSESGSCTANFVFVDARDVYLGSAAHCTGLGEATDTNGCTAPSLPLGTRVEVEGARYPARLAFSSWLTMQRRPSTNPAACQYNDFALLRLDRRDHARVNPTLPHWGGPVALGRDSSSLERVYTYGNSPLRLGLDLLKPKTGVSLGQSNNDWNHTVYTVTPGIPGDSGSAVLDSQGRALGTLSTVAIAPYALSNGVTDLRRALDYANRAGGMDVRLVRGASFRSGALPIGIG